MKKLLPLALITFSLSSVVSAELLDCVQAVSTAPIKGDRSSGEPQFPVAASQPGPEIFGQF
ncbi:MAG: hypothetical protein P1U86_10540 [Verrucomicrobiales bacterium]|nr:hypothetical protein [Verrucomicrobiales bacterium]